MRRRNWNNPTPPRPDQINWSRPIEWDHPLMRGCVAAYPLWLGNSLYSMWRDVGGRNRLENIIGSPTIASSPPFSSVLNCGGAGSLWKGSAIYSTAPYSMFGWGKPSGLTTSQPMFSQYGSTVGTNYANTLSFAGAAAGDPAKFYQFNGAALGQAISSTAYKDGVWQSILGVCIAANSRVVYLDGAGKGTDSTSVTNPGANVNRTAIGSEYNGSTSTTFAGQIAFAAVWNRALNDAEAWALWEPQTRWSMLNLASNRRVFTVPAAAPSFRAAWIPRRNQLIGGGIL